jgi:hypothetical protein
MHAAQKQEVLQPAICMLDGFGNRLRVVRTAELSSQQMPL